jgi:hypothetical protein
MPFAEEELPDILMVLVSGGADVSATNDYGDTVSRAALRSAIQISGNKCSGAVATTPKQY